MPATTNNPVINEELFNFWKTFKTLYPKAIIGSTFRTYKEQNELYQKGRSGDRILDKKAVVTYAKGGHSPHNFGLAFDIPNILNLDNIENLKYNINTMLTFYPEIEWGGNWKKEKYDPFHFQIRNWKEKLKSNPSPYIDFVRILSYPDSLIYEKIWNPTKKALVSMYKSGKSYFYLYMLIGLTGYLVYKKLK